MAAIRIVNPRTRIPEGAVVVNTTSRSRELWSRGLFPFHLGPVKMWDGSLCLNVENAWQYSKVYPDQVAALGDPTQQWYQWASAGWRSPSAVRYPRGRGAKPLYSYWAGRKYDYIGARKNLYCPIYATAVYNTEAFAILHQLYTTNREIWLIDFDGYDYIAKGKTLLDVINDPTKKMGHAFVLAMLLTDQYVWKT